MRTPIALLTLLASLSAAAAPPAAPSVPVPGDKQGNGGDPMVSRDRLVPFIERELKAAVLEYLSRVNPARIRDREAREAVTRMILRGGEHDVRGSRYRLAERCIDKDGVERAAVALMNDKNGSICFAPDFIIRERATPEEIVGLAVHEHAHHFGYEDARQRIISGVADTYDEAMRDAPALGTDQVRAASEPVFDEALLVGARPEYACSRDDGTIWLVSEHDYEIHRHSFGGLFGHQVERSRIKAAEVRGAACPGLPARPSPGAALVLQPESVHRRGSVTYYPFSKGLNTFAFPDGRLADSWIGGGSSPSIRARCARVGSAHAIEREEFLSAFAAGCR